MSVIESRCSNAFCWRQGIIAQMLIEVLKSLLAQLFFGKTSRKN